MIGRSFKLNDRYSTSLRPITRPVTDKNRIEKYN